MPRVSVMMPAYGQAAFVARAIDSLLAQHLFAWELVVVDDGSPDGTRDVVAAHLADSRIRYRRLPENRGLGAALNQGLRLATAPLVAYLPCDDIYYPEHLASLVACLEGQPGAVLAFSGVRHHYNRTSAGLVEGHGLQLVQVAHRRTGDEWIERAELVTDDLHRMFWHRLEPQGRFAGTGEVTCEWVDHPGQRHKLLREPVGGINVYRQRFRVAHPLRFHTTVGNRIDEVSAYARFRDRPPTPAAPDGLRILLVGELAYNPERILALEERGHRLYGLWMPDPYWYNTVGPVPFGHVEDLPRSSWQQAVRRLRPDVIYALLNWQAVPFARSVLEETRDLPFVWHFKEGPFICLEKGTWDDLVRLHTGSDGQVYTSPEMRDWFRLVLPRAMDDEATLVLDGDLPKREWFEGARSPRPVAWGDEIHTVVSGRPIGLHPATVGELATLGIHVHFYGDFTQGQWREWITRASSLAPRHLHLHGQVNQDRWVEELSQYDAGWLHLFESANGGDLRRANWDDLNYPARIATYAAAGLPMLLRDNRGAIVSPERLCRGLDVGVYFSTLPELRAQLGDHARLDGLRRNVWNSRPLFTFDEHADELVAFFRRIIARHAAGAHARPRRRRYRAAGRAVPAATTR